MVTEGWFHTQSLTNNGIYGKARQRDDASIVPYKSFAAFITIGKVSLRRDEGIPPYRDKIPFGVYTKKSRAFDSSAFAFYGDFLGNTAQFPPCGLSTAPAAAARHLRCQNAR